MTPSAFVVQWVERIASASPLPRTALDVAMGPGRHVEVLDRASYKVFGVELSLARAVEARHRSVERGANVCAWCADLTCYPLPRDRFDLVLVSRYLQRDLFPALEHTVRPGGVVLYETFTRDQRRHGRGPTSPDHLLEPGELNARFASFEVLFYEETTAPDSLARIVARRPRPAVSRALLV